MCGMRTFGVGWYASRVDGAVTGHRDGRVVREGNSMKKSRLTVVLCACSALTLAFASAAWAHVEVSPGQIPAGGAGTLTLGGATAKGGPPPQGRLGLPEGFEGGGA